MSDSLNASSHSNGIPFDDSCSLQQISDSIRIKERELHEIHEARCEALSVVTIATVETIPSAYSLLFCQMVSERDKMLQELSRRYNRLKEDFKYNLALIGSRDQDIERLETETHSLRTELEQSELQRNTLLSRLDIVEKRESDLKTSIEQERAESKVPEM